MTEHLLLERLPGEKMASRVSVRRHTLSVDLGTSGGGDDLGPDPHDLYDAALGACKSLTLMWLARRKGLDVQDVKVQVSRDASEERQGRYLLHTTITVHGRLTGAELTMLAQAAEKCPVQKLMTQVSTEISTSVIHNPAA